MLITLNVSKEVFTKWTEVAKTTREADYYYDTPHGYRTMEGKYFPEIVGKIEGTYSPKENVKCGWSFGTDFVQYATCGGNVWGMREEGESYVAYFSGRRSRVRDFIEMMKDSDPSFKKEAANIIVHESAAPADMKWWEIKDEYLERKAVEKEAAKKRAIENRRRSDRKFAKENNPFSVLKEIKAK